MKLSKRELFIIGCSLRYIAANLDDANEALKDDEYEEILCLGTGLAGSPVEPQEVEQLVEKIIENME